MSERTKRAVVTGGAGVIGKACCRRLLADGYGVLAVDLDKDLGAVLVEELDAGDQLTFHASDVTNELDVEGYVQQAIANSEESTPSSTMPVLKASSRRSSATRLTPSTASSPST